MSENSRATADARTIGSVARARATLAILLALCSLDAELPSRARAQHRLETLVVEAGRIPGDERLETDVEAKQRLDRTPGGVEQVDEKEIRETRSANLRDALELVPGVLVRPRFGSEEAQLSIRGSGLRNNFHLRGLNLLINGFAYGSADGFSDFESLELLSVKRIEIYKGANALRFGGNTIGGALDFVTLTGRDAPSSRPDVGRGEEERALAFGIRSEFGSWDYFKNQIGGGFVAGPFDGYLGLTDTELGGYRQHSEQVRRRAYASLGYDLGDDASLRLDLVFAHVQETLPGSLNREQFESDPEQANPEFVTQDAGRDYDFYLPMLTWSRPIGDRQLVEWLSQFSFQDLDHPLPFAVIDQDTSTWGSEVRYVDDGPLLGRENRFTIGLQYLQTQQADRQFENLGGARGAKIKDDRNLALNLGLYGEEQYLITEDWTLVLGGRVQWARRDVDKKIQDSGGLEGDVDYVNVTPRFGLLSQATPEIQVYANANNAVEPPLLLELTAPGNIAGSVDDLKEQDAWQFEVGTRGTLLDRVDFDLSVYDIELWDEIQNVNVQPFPGAPFTIPRFQNIPRSRHTGVEFGLDVTLAEDLIGPADWTGGGDALRFVNNLTFGSFRFVDDPTFGNNDIPGLPSLFLAAELRFETASGFWIAPGYEAVPSSYDVNSENTATAPAYALANFRSGYTYAPWNLQIFFEARNLNDVNYVSAVEVDSALGQYFYPGDGRSFYGGLQWAWR